MGIFAVRLNLLGNAQTGDLVFGLDSNCTIDFSGSSDESSLKSFMKNKSSMFFFQKNKSFNESIFFGFV